MPELFGFMLGVWSLWTAQAWWQAYSRPARARKAFAKAFREAQRRRVLVYDDAFDAMVYAHTGIRR